MKDRFKLRYVYKNKIYDVYAVDFCEGKAQLVSLNGSEMLFTKIDTDKLFQCTGLRDKNDKLIYEGDILKVEFPGNKLHPFILATINWDKQKYMLKRINTNVWLPHAAVALRDLKNSTVMGNIYENPELLEEKQCN